MLNQFCLWNGLVSQMNQGWCQKFCFASFVLSESPHKKLIAFKDSITLMRSVKDHFYLIRNLLKFVYDWSKFIKQLIAFDLWMKSKWTTKRSACLPGWRSRYTWDSLAMFKCSSPRLCKNLFLIILTHSWYDLLKSRSFLVGVPLAIGLLWSRERTWLYFATR